MNRLLFLSSLLLFLACNNQTATQTENSDTSPSDSLILKETEGGYQFFYPDGSLAIEQGYFMAAEFSEAGFAAVADQEGWAYIDKKGNVWLRPFIYDNGPDYFSEGVARYVENEKMGLFTEKGEKLTKASYTFIRPMKEGRAAFCEGCETVRELEVSRIEGGKWGFLDEDGKVVIKPIYDHVADFMNGQSKVEKEGKTLQIDRKGNEL